MKPKTLIIVGILVAIWKLAGALWNMMYLVFTFRDNPIIPYSFLRPIVLTEGLFAIFFTVFAFALFNRLFKTSLFLLIAYFLLIVRSFLTAEYFTYLKVIFDAIPIFLLSLGVYGVYKEKNLQKINNLEQPVNANR